MYKYKQDSNTIATEAYKWDSGKSLVTYVNLYPIVQISSWLISNCG